MYPTCKLSRITNETYTTWLYCKTWQLSCSFINSIFFLFQCLGTFMQTSIHNHHHEHSVAYMTREIQIYLSQKAYCTFKWNDKIFSNVTVLILFNTLWVYFTIAYSLNIRLFVYVINTCIYLYFYKHTSYTNRLCWYVVLLLFPFPKFLMFTICIIL